MFLPYTTLESAWLLNAWPLEVLHPLLGGCGTHYLCEMIAKLFQIASIAMLLHVFGSSYEYLVQCLQMKILDLGFER